MPLYRHPTALTLRDIGPCGDNYDMRAIAWRPEQRVSDRERGAAAETLQRACGEGYLSAETLEERIDVAFHAKRRFETGWLLTDVGSRNGTRVNGWRIVDAVLHPGDLVHIGGVSFVFVDR